MRMKTKVILCICACVLLAAVVLSVLYFAFWRRTEANVASLELILDKDGPAGPVYVLEISGDYCFDDFLEQGGAASDRELIDFLNEHLLREDLSNTLEPPDIGCSSFTCVDAGGDRYFARNYDFEDTTAVIVKTDPGNGRYASISGVDMKYLGLENGAYIEEEYEELCLAAAYVPLDGINEAGVACAVYMSYQGSNRGTPTDQSSYKPDLTTTTMLRLILDYAGSVDEAVELVREFDLHDSANTSYHYMVADSSGKSAILEWVGESDATDTNGTGRTLQVYYNNKDAALGETEGENRFQYITNFIVAPDYYESDWEKLGLDRYEKIADTINPDGKNKKGVLSKRNALELLEDIGMSGTVWSILYNLTDGALTWVSGMEFDDPDAVFHFSLS